ncbi:MAG: Wzz/FepE/Etk N-terminal domain-containing protein [Pseudomonadota bacterium]
MTEDLSWRDIYTTLWRRRILILTALALAVLSFVLYLRFADDRFAAVAVLSPRQQGQLDSLTSRLARSPFGSLASSGTVTPFERFIESTRSPVVAQRIDKDLDLKSALFSSQWDAQTETWHKPSGTKALIAGLVRRAVGRDWIAPDAKAISNAVSKRVEMRGIRETAMIEISLESTDPAFALAALERLIIEADRLVRQRDEANLEEQIEKLQNRLAEVAVSDHRASIIDVLSSLERQLSILKSSEYYSLHLVLAPIVPAQPVYPRPMFGLLLACIIGITAGVSISIGLEIFSKKRNLSIEP